jgi:hypothetical protein
VEYIITPITGEIIIVITPAAYDVIIICVERVVIVDYPIAIIATDKHTTTVYTIVANHSPMIGM